MAFSALSVRSTLFLPIQSTCTFRNDCIFTVSQNWEPSSTWITFFILPFLYVTMDLRSDSTDCSTVLLSYFFDFCLIPHSLPCFLFICIYHLVFIGPSQFLWLLIWSSPFILQLQLSNRLWHYDGKSLWYLCVKCLSIQIILRLCMFTYFMFVIIAEILHDHMHLLSLNDVSFPVSCLCERFLINTRHVRHPQPLSHSSKGRPGKWNCKRRGGRGLGALFYVKLTGGGGAWQEVLESFLVEALPPLACHAWWRFSNTAVNSILLSFLAMS